MEKFKRILVYRTGHLGDTLVSLPAFWAIRKSFPESHITLLTNSNPSNRQFIAPQNVLPKKGLFDDWLAYPTGLSTLHSLQTFTKLFVEIRRGRYDCLFILSTRNRTVKQLRRDTFFFRLAGIKKIIGTKYLLKNLLLTDSVRPLPVVESEIDYLLKCISEEDFPLPPSEDYKPEMLLTQGEKNFADDWLRNNCGKFYTDKKLFALAPSSKWESKIWSEKRFREVVQNLILQKNLFPVIFGGIEDREVGNRLLESWKIGANAAGKLNIREAAAALRHCLFYLGNDTGTMHLAASVGTPCVAIFSAIDWAGRWKPFGEDHQIFRQTVPCEGCLSSICKFESQCLEAIGVKDVLAACFNILDKIEKKENENSYFHNKI